MTIKITKGNKNPVSDFFSSAAQTPETEAPARLMCNVSSDFARKLKYERDEAREENKNLKLQLGLWEDGNLICEETLGEIRLLEERIEEAQKELSSIHRWIDKNHADGFIDSLTYLQNLERVTDSWYDRIDGIEADARRFVRERDEARDMVENLTHHGLSLMDSNRMLKRERDEARDRVDELTTAIKGLRAIMRQEATK
jgi:predicted  nucleic acid-binding Zn-ribbon protein